MSTTTLERELPGVPATLEALTLEELCEQFEALGREIIRREPVALMSSLNYLRREAEFASPPGKGANHPLASVVGSMKHDPFADDYWKLVEEARHELNEQDNQSALTDVPKFTLDQIQ